MTGPGALLVATSRQLLLVDGDEVRVVHEGSGLYFGMAALGERYYVACHHDTIANPTPEQLDAQVGTLLVLDRDLQLVDERRSSAAPLRQPHAVAAIAGSIWITCSYDDNVQVHDPDSGAWHIWTPDRGSGPPRPDHDDRFHYNYIRGVHGGLQLLAHNYGRSQVLSYALPDLQLVSVTDLGVGAHDLFDVGGAVATCSSLESALRGADGWARRVGGFPRGIVTNAQGAVIGFSEFAGRVDRHATDGRLVRFDPCWRPTAEILLPGSGQVLDLLELPVAREQVQALPPRSATVRRGAVLDAREVTSYRVPLGAPPLPYGDWHPGEVGLQHMAARRARVPVLINPGERMLTIEAASYRVDRSPCRILLDGRLLGELVWDAPGDASGTFRLPRRFRDRSAAVAAELALEVDQLWRPEGDTRLIGVSLRSISFG